MLLGRVWLGGQVDLLLQRLQLLLLCGAPQGWRALLGRSMQKAGDVVDKVWRGAGAVAEGKQAGSTASRCRRCQRRP